MAEVLLRRRSLGDVVLLGAVTAALGGVTLVTERRFHPVAERLRGVSRVLPWEALGEVRGEVVDLQRSPATIAAHPFARRIRKHTLRRRARLLGLPVARPTVPELYAAAAGVSPVAAPWIDAPGGPALALIPGASTELKRWDPLGFVEVGRAWPGEVVVVGGPGEEALVRRVAALVPGAEVVVESGFAATLDALGRCAVAVGGDTGLLHLAAAVGAAPVGLFGPTHPDDGFFPYPRGRVVELALPCRPCTSHRGTRCRVGHRACLDLSARAVVEVIASLTSSRGT